MVPLDEAIARSIIWIIYYVGVFFVIFWLGIYLVGKQQRIVKTWKKWPKACVIVPVWNEQSTVEGTIDSLFAMDYPKDKIEVICVNDGSTDNTANVLGRLAKKYPQLKIITQKNKGKHAAVNKGLSMTDAPFFACLDADSFASKDCLKGLLGGFTSKEIAAVMPVIKVYNPKNTILKVQWLEFMLNIFLKHIMGRLDCIHVTPGPFTLYRTKIVKELGGFQKGHGTEDLEMALRLQNKHYVIRQTLDTYVYANQPKTTKSLVVQRTRWYQGTVGNCVDYKHMFFNKKYGDFGAFHMPMVLLTGFLTLVGAVVSGYLIGKEIYHFVKRLLLIDFQILPYIQNWTFRFDILAFDWQFIFSTIIVFGLLVLSIFFAFKSHDEKLSLMKETKYLVMFFYYLFIYNILMAYIWARVYYKVLFRKASVWR